MDLEHPVARQMRLQAVGSFELYRGVDTIQFRTQINSCLFAMAVHANDPRPPGGGTTIVAADTWA